MKNYIAISGSIFAIVAFAHLIRIIDGKMSKTTSYYKNGEVKRVEEYVI